MVGERYNVPVYVTSFGIGREAIIMAIISCRRYVRSTISTRLVCSTKNFTISACHSILHWITYDYTPCIFRVVEDVVVL